MNKIETVIAPNSFSFNTGLNNTSWVMRITPDRRIEINDDVDVTEAAKVVLKIVNELLAKDLTDTDIKDLWKIAGGSFNMGNQHEYPYAQIDNPIAFARAIEKKVRGE